MRSLLPRQAFIDPLSFVGLTVVGGIVHSPQTLLQRSKNAEELLRFPSVLEKLETLPAVDYRALVLLSVVQAGLDRFAVLEAPVNLEGYPESFKKHAGGPLESQDLPPYLRARLDLPGSDEWLALGHRIEESIAQAVPDYRVTSSFATQKCHALITDLLFGLQRGQHIIIDTSIEEVNRLSEKLPDEVGVPFRNLVAGMRPVHPDVCIPRSEVGRDQIVRFRELLGGVPYSEYQGEHASIATSQRSLVSSVGSLTDSAKRLWEANPDLVRVQNTTISVLPDGVEAASKLVGGLPGALLSFLGSTAEKFLRAKRRLVVYELGGLLDDIMQRRIRDAVVAGWPQDSGGGKQEDAVA